MLSKISQRKTDIIWFHSNMEFNKQNKWTKTERESTHTRERQTEKQTLKHREQTDRYQRGGGKRMGEIGDGN